MLLPIWARKVTEIYTTEVAAIIYKTTCPRILIVALFVNVKTQKQSVKSISSRMFGINYGISLLWNIMQVLKNELYLHIVIWKVVHNVLFGEENKLPIFI